MSPEPSPCAIPALDPLASEAEDEDDEEDDEDEMDENENEFELFGDR